MEQRLFTIFQSALITKKRTEAFLKNIHACIDFEAKLHYESYETYFEIEKSNLMNKNTSKKTLNEVEVNSQELAMSYLPYWDTKLTESKEADTKKAQEWFELSRNEAHNMCKRINCFTFRDFILYYRTNQRLYSPAELKELNRKGIDDIRITKFVKLINFLSAQWLAFPSELSSFLSMTQQKIKLDLSLIKLNRPESLQAIVSAYFNCGHLLRRLDISGCKLSHDISYIINQIIVKIEKDRAAKERAEMEKPERERQKLDKFQLDELCISCNGFSEKCMDQLLKYGQRIRSFGLDKVGIDKKVCDRFQTFIMVMKNLRVLSLDFNNIGNQPISLILDRLKLSPSLFYLNISENLLTQDIIPQLKRYLSENKHLECLECERNIFPDSAVDEISKALTSNTSTKLKVFRFGGFRPSAINFENVFKLSFNNAPLVAVGSITVMQKSTSEEIFNQLAVGLD